MDPGFIDTIVIGAGQAGLSASWHLRRAGVDHVILERDRIAEAWRTRRWDSFTLVTPNRMIALPGFPAETADPSGFLQRDDLVDGFERWARGFEAPVIEGMPVEAVEQASGGYRVVTPAGQWRARRVVVATGYYVRPRWPAFAGEIDPAVLQLDAGQYRNPGALPPGGVLVVGSGQSGCQIAEELLAAGRDTWLSIGSAGRLPRRYRGRDGFEWLIDLGFFDLPEDRFPDPRGRATPNPHLSGARGGHSINLHLLARRGIHLLGHATGLEDASGSRLRIAPDTHDSLRAADAYRDRMAAAADALVERTGMAVAGPDEGDDEPHATDGYRAAAPELLDLRAEGIATVIWACGYRPDFSFLHVPVLDDAGYPVHVAGLPRTAGLGFVGLRFQRTARSDLLFGAADDARLVVDALLHASA